MCVYVFFFLNCNLKLLHLQACKIVGGQRYTKRLNEKQITALLKVTCQRPRDRENDILQVLWELLLWEFLLSYHNVFTGTGYLLPNRKMMLSLLQ